MELEEELKNIKNNLAKQIEIHENEKREAEQLLNQQKEQLKKVNDEERVKINQLVSCYFFFYSLGFSNYFLNLKKKYFIMLQIEERGEIEKKLALAHTNAETSIQTLKVSSNSLKSLIVCLVSTEAPVKCCFMKL